LCTLDAFSVVRIKTLENMFVA